VTLISDRPRRWNEIIGQERVLRVLSAVLNNPRYMTLGYIFEGPFAVGKTSTAYLFARALMCRGEDPLGCGDKHPCASCEQAFEDLNAHPNFREVDAATYSGVQNARDLMNFITDAPTMLSDRRVVILDEAHRLTREAWDVFLKPLESRQTSAVFIFVSSEGGAIPATIRSRCATLNFCEASVQALTGKLAQIAGELNVGFTQAGLMMLAKAAKGKLRDAVNAFSLAAAQGRVDENTVVSVVNFGYETRAIELIDRVVQGGLAQAILDAESLASEIGPCRLIHTMFAAYGRRSFMDSAEAMNGYPARRDMVSLFLRWSATEKLPVEAISLFLAELSDLCRLLKSTHLNLPSSPSAQLGSGTASTPPPAQPIMADSSPKVSFKQRLGI
jgi:DNA polymerase-3 subunit gamma/tau